MGRHKDPNLRVKRDKKRCSKCGLIRSIDKFPKNKRAPDGLGYHCKDCEEAYNTAYHKLRRAGKLAVFRVVAGIDSWNQIDSVLRELSEAQYRINTETNLCKQRKKMIEQYTQEITEPLAAHQISLQKMLVDFLKKNREKAKQVTVCRFGAVCFRRGKVELTLKPALAGKRMEKP
ncbi:hypothetical protein ES703_64517 [subsurface metagenome]